MAAYTIRKQLISIGRDYHVENDAKEVLFRIDGRLRFARTFSVNEATGAKLLHVREKLLCIDPTFIVKRDGVEVARVVRTTTGGARVDHFKIQLASGDHCTASGKLREERGITIAQFGNIQRDQNPLIAEIFRLVTSDNADQALAIAIAMSIVEMQWHRGENVGSLPTT